ncbi:hypothetical protein GALMADRAFT_236782 [Galerina marginata CBS 339.88]|uniref:Right handed beta helix domain-containing protein n=1 Tax=Galerina marginata (strain CBS 339.88) TaxID=685588 RepID=A0A067TVZ4_GALM3|nr:hypothetical protein GALMADRAFT_236782 [Galerina marginata CBS 339.88]
MVRVLGGSVGHGQLKRHSYAENTRRDGACEPADPANTVTDRLNNLLANGGSGYTLQLCPNQTYLIQAPILFANSNQEISTQGYPTGTERAVLAVSGPVSNGQGHTTAVDGTCGTCSGVKLRHVQIDGTRRGAPPTDGGANIEMGGGNSNQLVEFVRSYDPRSWSCLHIAEGPFTCDGVTVQNNDIGPCGSDAFQEWADGISVSCRNAIIRNNMIQDPTDGGIVIFGAPGTQVYNNTIWILNATLLGGINLVDYDPWNGDFTGTVVHDNVILGGFATDKDDADSKGNNFENAIIKIGIAVGPRTWFGDKYGSNVVKNGVIQNNRLSGAFSYGVAVSSATNFTVQGNVMFGNTSFIGARGPNCSDTDVVPTPGPFIWDQNSTTASSLQSDFQLIADGNALTCVLPPNGGDFWPYGLNPSNSSSPTTTGSGTTSSTNGSGAHGGSGSKNSAGIAVGVVVGVIACGIAAWFVRKYVLSRRESSRLYNSTKADYTQKI